MKQQFNAKDIDNLEFERQLQNEGYTFICGTDEVGRGPLIGPVVAAAVIMPLDDIIEGVTDSKKLNEKKRNELDKLIKEKALSYDICFIDSKTIDEINILEASRLAMTNAIKNLRIKPDAIISDCMKLDIDNIINLSIIKGDLRSYSVGCASIIAKVARDEYMDELAKKYPHYSFEKNKGYPTKQHFEALEKYGVLDEHRRSFGPVKKRLVKQLSLFIEE